MALAFACAMGASGAARAQSEAEKPKAEGSTEPKHEESKDATRDNKSDAQSEQKPKAARGNTSAEKSTEKAADKAAEKKSRAENGAYVRKLGQIIRSRAPGVTSLGSGSAVVRFHIGPSGAPNSVSVVSASTPKHGELARSIVSGLRSPPPPGGSYDGVQSFRFH